jgi:hypothetical protein
MADDNGPAMTITMVVCTIVSFIFMCLRLWCKQNMSSKVGFDDAVLALSWVRLPPSSLSPEEPLPTWTGANSSGSRRCS